MHQQGLYRGIVVQNNDPQQSGRVKVYVPGINLNQSKNWNQSKEEDKFFRVMGGNTGSSLNPEVLNSQKERLLWAEVMLPIIGMSSPGFYNAPSDSFYIGNDSDYISQESNKTPAAFQKDKQQSKDRPETSPLPNYGQDPRTSTDLNFPTIGLPFCLPDKCDKSGPIKSNLRKTNTDLDEVINEIPREFIEQTVVLDQPLPNDNISIVGIDIALTNPQILVNDEPISEDNPLYNRECFTPVDTTGMLTFSPPILFEDSDEEPSSSYNDLPVGLIINDQKSLPNNFKVSSFNDNEIVFQDGPIKVKTNKKNINSINVKHNKKPFDLSKVTALLALLKKAITVNSGAPVMPRSPVTNGQTMISRGGGGGEIFNNVSSKLLPTTQRKDMHLGGANNESRATVNRCRKPSNDPNNTKGANVIGNVSQMHRGPMRSPDYNNDFKGMVSIPGVGAHVWIYFENGDLNYPIILGSFAAKVDYRGIYESA